MEIAKIKSTKKMMLGKNGKHNPNSSTRIIFPSKVVQHLGTKDVVIFNWYDRLEIKPSDIDSIRIRRINVKNNLSIPFDDNLDGEYEVEYIEDGVVLTKI